MTRITLDPQMIAQLQAVSGEVELCDSAGNLVGWYAPAKQNGKEPTAQELIDSCPLSEEELLQRVEAAKNQKGRTWPEIKGDLESK